MKKGITFLVCHFIFLKFFFRQKRFVRGIVASEIGGFFNDNDGSLSLNTYDRIKYYANLMPLVAGDAYGILLGKKLTEKERLLQTYLAILTPLIDDFFDYEKRTDDEVKRIIFYPESINPKNQAENLVIFILKKLHSLASNSDWKDMAHQVIWWQSRSAYAVEEDSSAMQIKEATFKKGGYALLLARKLLDTKLIPEEAEAVIQLGGMIQYNDDIFDVWEDLQSGNITLVTSAQGIKPLVVDYAASLEKMIKSFTRLSFYTRDKKGFTNGLLLLFVRGFVALEQLERLHKKNPKKFDFKDYGRNELICDMETVSNFFKTYKYYRNLRYS